MNIIEAFQRGGRVKRSGWDEYYTPSELLATRNLLPNAILADDWEVEERDVSITRQQFVLAWNKIVSSTAASTRDLLAKELGL